MQVQMFPSNIEYKCITIVTSTEKCNTMYIDHLISSNLILWDDSYCIVVYRILLQHLLTGIEESSLNIKTLIWLFLIPTLRLSKTARLPGTILTLSVYPIVSGRYFHGCYSVFSEISGSTPTLWQP